METGRVVPCELLQAALEQVPISVKHLAPLVDYFAELNNAPNAPDIELTAPEGETWESFTKNWLQTCAWVPGAKIRKKLSQLTLDDREPSELSTPSERDTASEPSV